MYKYKTQSITQPQCGAVASMMFFSCLFLLCLLLNSCGERRPEKLVTPWGEVVSDTVSTESTFSVDDMINNGEMIVLTISGPETYFDYHGRGMGTQYLLCEKFAHQLGVSLRVELCKDTAEMVRRLDAGEADLIAYMLPKKSKLSADLLFCGAAIDSLGVQWAVAKGNRQLAQSLNDWYKPGMIDKVKKEERFLFSARSVTRHVYAPFLDRSRGVISNYDHLFRRYAPAARWDWKLLAAQCYQESCFDPNARSWAGATGLMQIMPSTADHLGLAHSDLTNPERSVEAAVRFICELTAKFREIPSFTERQCFVLASYNGGANHIKDAMALTRKNGGNPHRWSHVAPYVLRLQQPQFYNDPVVKYGYMRGSETVDYVERIRQRYAKYRGVSYHGPAVTTGSGSLPESYSPGGMEPRRATKKYRYHI